MLPMIPILMVMLILMMMNAAALTLMTLPVITGSSIRPGLYLGPVVHESTEEEPSE
jgi:hypothetical protein